MAGTPFSPFKSRFLLLTIVLLLFTPPIFSMLVFFWPLIVSTVLGVLAVVSFGHDGIPTGQKEEASENRAANPDIVVSSTADMEKISDVLMVGNQEVTWLEWLHNEDMENCRARERANCIPARWDLDELDVVCEASVGVLSSRVEERSMVDVNSSIIVDENSAYEQVENAGDIPTTHDDIWVRSLVDKKLNLAGLESPVLDVIEDVDVVRRNAPSLKVEDTKEECVLAEKVTNVTQKDGELLIAEGALVMNAFTKTRSTGSDYGFAARDEVETSIAGLALAAQGKTSVHAVALEVRDATTTPGRGSKLAVANQANEYTSVDADGECILPSLTSKAMASKASCAKEQISFTPEMEALEGHELRHIQEKDAEERDSLENNEGPIWDVSDEEETKSSLRFSFFDNGCVTLTSVKHEAEDVTLHT